VSPGGGAETQRRRSVAEMATLKAQRSQITPYPVWPGAYRNALADVCVRQRGSFLALILTELHTTPQYDAMHPGPAKLRLKPSRGRTPNFQLPAGRGPTVRCWSLDVRCSTFRKLDSVVND
jgi:hypothetical protein